MGLHIRCSPFTFGLHRCPLVDISNQGLDTLLRAGCETETTRITHVRIRTRTFSVPSIENSSIYDDRSNVRAYRDYLIVNMEPSSERPDQSGCAESLDTDDSSCFEGAHIWITDVWKGNTAEAVYWANQRRAEGQYSRLRSRPHARVTQYGRFWGRGVRLASTGCY